MTKSIKFLNNNFIKVDGVLYTPYLIGDLPDSFGCIAYGEDSSDGYSRWFNYKGLTYLIKK